MITLSGEIKRKSWFNKSNEVVFCAWHGREWTEAEKEWICSRHPDGKQFMKPLSKTIPPELERAGEEEVDLYKDLASLISEGGRTDCPPQL